MLSLRALSRALPKTLFNKSPVRCLSSVSRTAFYRPVWQPATRTTYPAFSTSCARREPAGESDQELSAKIEQEYQLEVENNDSSKLTPLNDYLSDSGFEITDVPGTHEVTLTKTFGNEQIKIEFSISDINNLDEEFDQSEEDDAFDDEAEFDSGKNTINQAGVRGGKVDVLPEDSIAPADRDAGEAPEDYPTTPAFPIDLRIIITKPGDQALEIHAVAADGTIEPQTINYAPKASALLAKSGKDAQEVQAQYYGPPVSNLDAELQLLLERYLEDRGINTELANFLPDYVEYKEQKEYVSWLQSLKKFIDI
ncbi:hypothetical protein LTR84_011351 [Exophiala bonariae]|uniref:Mitochondrial glycoprotein n=1 Tax=Exophiala bonariae TaxID=1690606 RepID=A0AAV9MSI9_9EURO|nr:hypothetical protein LTR84_011351 [Exophiala bonariae]